MIKVKREFFDIKATLECGQVFRYFLLDDGYKVVSGNKQCTIKNKGDFVQIYTNHQDYFYNYFDLFRDYGKVYNTLIGCDQLKQHANLCKGIHILRQDLFETIISFIISANNNIKRIKSIIERIATSYGSKIDEHTYAFPTPAQMSGIKVEDYVKLGAGYRADYIFCAVNTLNTHDLLDEIVKMDYPSVIECLTTLKGVGTKVADCIALFALGHTNCYPVDTNIFNFDNKLNLTKSTKAINQIRINGINKYGELAGFAQQWKFYAQLNK